MEGGKIHFETRIEPVGDPTIKIEWLKNGQSIEASKCYCIFIKCPCLLANFVFEMILLYEQQE